MKKYLFSNLEEILKKYITNKTVIDIGAGLGDDPWKHRLIMKYAKKSLAVDNWLPNDLSLISDINYIKCKIEELNLNERYDIVCAFEVIEHIANQNDFLKKCVSLMKDDGKIIISTPNSTWIHNFLYILIHNKDPRENKIFDKTSEVYVSGHFLIHNISTLQQLFYSVGLKVEKVYYSCPKNERKLKSILRSLIYKYRPQFAETILIIGSKL